MRQAVAAELGVGMVIRSHRDRCYRIVGIIPGMAGPYLTLENTATGERVEHDTSFDSRSATYAVEPDGQ